MKLIAVFLLLTTCSVAQFTRATEPTESNSLMSRAIKSVTGEASICVSLNQYDYAITILLILSGVIPEFYTVLHNLGYTLNKCGHMDRAAKVYDKITQLVPDFALKGYDLSLALLAFNYLGQTKHEDTPRWTTFDKVHTMFEQPLRDSDDALQETFKREEEFEKLFESANEFLTRKRYDEAMRVYTKIFKDHPIIDMIMYNLGYTLKQCGDMDTAIEIHHKAVEQIPGYLSEFCSLSLPLLILQDRLSTPMFDQPAWDGKDPTGKTIMLHITPPEGLGDTLQTIRFAKLLKQRGATVIAKVQKPLEDILALCDYIDTVVTSYENLPQFDAHFAMWGMIKTDELLADIPYLYANKQLIRAWKEKLADDTNFKIGVCWQANANYDTSFDIRSATKRSMTAQTVAPLTQLEGVSIYSLQKFGGEDQLEHLNNSCSIKSFGLDLDTQHGRFMDTAAIMKNLDLVITIDTSIAHLAGGLGVPTWILLPENPDLRWSYNESESPFYPTMRLFRQTEDGDWQSVIEEVKIELIKLVQSPNTKELS